MERPETGAGGASRARRRVLFLCTGNSSRSQMAEAIVNARAGQQWEAFSAGTHPAGFVHPAAIRALAEIGIDASGARSKPADEFRNRPFDLVVTVCDQAAEECPVWLGSGRRLHLGFPDPAKVLGEDARVMAAFRCVRDAILKEIPALLAKQPNR
jgi:arsenate reductase